MHVDVTTDLVETYRRDGVVHLRGALDADILARFEATYEASLRIPSPSLTKFYPESGGTFIQDLANTRFWTEWAETLRASVIPDVVAELWGAESVWLYYEQIFLKEGGRTRRTPWHQDSSYLPVTLEQVANVWISFDPVSKDDALEFVRGSHRDVMYSPSAFDADDDTAPLDPQAPLPRLPDIEAARGEWDIVSWAVEPGDLIIFDIGLLHGGAATTPGRRRRTVALRCFGDLTRLQARGPMSHQPEDDAPDLVKIHAEIGPGQPLATHRSFPRLRGITS
jgi:ectoine hydroxylase-related dioxygenase (phytanoyl-CoA dioxygenase family)